MKSHNTRPRTTHRYNTDVDELSINRFERADYIYKVKSCLYRDELLQTDQKEEYLRAFPKSLRRYRYHSVINVKIEHITSYKENYKFLKNMKRKSDMNSEILLADCLEVYNQLPEGHQKDALYDLIGLVIQLKDTDVPRLRESECEKIFRRIQNLVNLINMTRRERTTSIEFQLREDDDSPGKMKGSKMTRRIKFLLARFEFIIATLGHFIHYNKLANTLQKKVHQRAINAKPVNGAFTSSVFTSMETKTKKDSEPQVRRKQSSSNNNKSVSRKESLDGPMIVERQQSYREENDETLTESKFQQVKAYFKWKLEKWKDQDLEDIVLVCRICSKSMFAKIMKKHSPHCKKVAEEERIMKEFSKRISNTIHQVTKEKHVVNVELKIEKKQLTSLRAAQLEYSREIDQHNSEEEDSTDSMETTPIQRAQTTVASFLQNNGSHSEEKYSVKIHEVKDDLKSFVLSANKESKEKVTRQDRPFPFLFVSTENDDRESNGSPTDFPPLDDPQSPVAQLSREGSRKAVKASMARSRSQNRLEEEKADFEEPEAGINSFFEKMKKVADEKEDENEEIEDIANEVSLLGITKAKSQYTNKKFPGLEISTKKDFLESPPSEAFLDPNNGGERCAFRRSNTQMIMLGSPLLSATRRSSKKTDKSESPLPKSTQTLNVLRERLEKIKGIQTLIKGYDAVLHYANLVDNFNEFSSEARVVYEQARSEISGSSDKVKSNIKFDEYTKEFLQVLAEKLEQLKLIDASKKELKLLELANVESSESNKEENGTNPQEAKSSYDSFEMVSTSEISPILPGRKSVGFAKTMISEFDRKKPLATPDESPVTRKKRKLKSKSVEKQSNNLRYELFEKSLQKIIKRNKKVKMEGMSISSPGKRSKFFRNSMFVSGFSEDPREEENEEDDDNFMEESKKSWKEKRSSRGSGTLNQQEIPEQEESSMSDEESESDETEKSDSYKEEDLENDIDLNTQTNEKECFSDDESNLRRYAKKQEGFSSLITIEDFDFIKLISKGAYGRVWLVKRKITGDHYAMKIINFADRKNMNQIASLKTEKKVFEKLKGDFVVKAIFTFVHNSYLCIVMEFMIGGDFGHILEKFGALEEDDARFYIAEMVLALDNLHQLEIVHRDLKPDNILLNKNGHIKLTDFGLSEVGVQKHTKIKKAAKRNSIFNSLTAAKESDKRLSLMMIPTTIPTKPVEKPATNILKDEFSTIPEVDEEAPEIAPPKETGGNRVIGTPDYMAPEVINGTCYDDPCIDWWSVGVLLFEFLVGIPPFNDPDVDVVFENIVKRKIPWDELQIGYDEGCITPEAKDLIDSLLELDRTKRLGAKGIDEIKSHVFFKKINWDEILKSKAPIIPVTENDIDVSNFEKENKKFLQSELENPFHGGNEGTQSVSINKENFELARVDILHEENEKVVSEATNTISQEELEKMRKARLVNRKWSVFD